MSVVEAAIADARCALAVSGSLVRDEAVVLALKEREALLPMTLSGPAMSPMIEVSDAGVARAIGRKHGVLVLVEPGPPDQAGLTKLAQVLAAAPFKPTIVVVAKRFNAFQMQALFRGLKVEHVKERAQVFLAALPVPPEETAADVPDVPKAKDRKKVSEPDAPRFAFVGRDEELATLVGMLGEGGPIVISGPRGIGRTTLVEHAIAATELERLPDLSLGLADGFDTLVARLAEVAKAGGNDTLATTLAGPHTPLQVVAAAIESLAAAEGNATQAMVVHNLQIAIGRDGSSFRKSRLELLIEALLTGTYPLRLIFTSVVQPVFFREGRDAGLRRMTLTGIKGRFYHEILEAYHVPEFPRDKIGPISEKLHGNPLAVRTFGMALHHDPALVDNDKYFRMDGPDDEATLLKQLDKRVQRLDERQRTLLARLAHLRHAVDGKILAEMEVNRKVRTALVAAGVLDMVGTETGTKRYQVHELVTRVLGSRETSDFRVYEGVAGVLRQAASGAEGLEKFALLQEANHCMMAARRFGDVTDLGYPDQDPKLDAIYGMMRSRTGARPDLADQRIREVLNADPSNADAHLARLELLRHTDGKAEDWKEAIDAAIEQAPVPEIFHEVVSHHLARNARGQAIRVLEQAVEILPDQSRLRCRLASLLTRQGRRPEAIEQLKTAMELDPMLPDAYGLLGTLRREEGAEALDAAETLLREAVRLAPTDVVQVSRLVWLLLDIHKGVPERREAVADEIKTLLDAVLQADKESWETHLTYAVALREMRGDLERAGWFLNKARKLAPNRRSLGSRFELEAALLQTARGKVDDAENQLRKLARQDPTNHRVFAGIARIHEARGQLVAAHAELLRAAERTSPHSLDRQAYELDLQRLQALIEAGAMAMFEAAGGALPAPEASAPADEPAPAPKPRSKTRHARQPASADAPEATEPTEEPVDEQASASDEAPDTEVADAPQPAEEPAAEQAPPPAEPPAPESDAFPPDDVTEVEGTEPPAEADKTDA